MNTLIYKVEKENDLASQLTNDARTAELLDQLELTEQKALLDSTSLSRMMYAPATPEEMFVIQSLCPKWTSLEDYKSSLIPVEVLEALKEAKELNFFQGFRIYHPAEAVERDPFLIGLRVTLNSWGGSDTTYYLIARWGKECLVDLAELFPSCVESYHKRYLAELENIADQIEVQLRKRRRMLERNTIPDLTISPHSTPTFYF